MVTDAAHKDASHDQQHTPTNGNDSDASTQRALDTAASHSQPRADIDVDNPLKGISMPEEWQRLSPKKRTFVAHWLLNGGDREAAAIAAGYASHSARQAASKILKEPTTRAVLSKLTLEIQRHSVQQSGDELIATVAERKAILSAIGRGKLSDYVTCGADGVWFINVGPETKNAAAIESITSRTEMSGEGDGAKPVSVVTIKLRDPVPALRELNRMERIGNTIEQNITVNVGKLTLAQVLEQSSRRPVAPTLRRVIEAESVVKA